MRDSHASSAASGLAAPPGVRGAAARDGRSSAPGPLAAPASTRPTARPTSRHTASLPRLAAALAALLGLALVAWASLSTTPILVLPTASDAATADPLPLPTTTALATVPPLTSELDATGSGGAFWRIAAGAVVLLADAGVLVLAVALLRALIRLIRRSLRLARGPEPDDLGEDGLDLSVLTAERAARQARLLREGSPRNAIVATWLELERLVADAGVACRPVETSSELVVRVLASASAPEAPLEDLAALFREARFSRHEMPEELRERAVRDLERVHDALGVGVPVAAGASSDGAAPGPASGPPPAAGQEGVR